MEMYEAIANSPIARLTAGIANNTMSIAVDKLEAFPDAPNLATIGEVGDDVLETVRYSAKSGSSGPGTLTISDRGYEGTALEWDEGTPIIRGLTAHDLNALKDYIENHDDAEMPHQFEDNGTIYKWGLTIEDNEPVFIYEEVT